MEGLELGGLLVGLGEEFGGVVVLGWEEEVGEKSNLGFPKVGVWRLGWE